METVYFNHDFISNEGNLIICFCDRKILLNGIRSLKKENKKGEEEQSKMEVKFYNFSFTLF